MRVAYEDLDDKQFERLVVEMMVDLFGPGVQGFAEGADGGRDARFQGTANTFPSARTPWSGITVGQAKHTSAMNAHFGERSFSGESSSSVISEEIERVQQLVKDGELDNYILFSNRRLGGVAGPAITKRIADSAGLDSAHVFLVGVEHMDRLLQASPDLLARARIDPLDGPLLVSSYDLAEVILGIASALGATLPTEEAPVVDRVTYADKNRENRMSAEFAAELSQRYLPQTAAISRFLASPGNKEVRLRYEAAVEDFQLQIVAKRADYQAFDDVFNYIVRLLLGRDRILSSNASLTRSMLFYMYWHCDIGRTP